MLCGSRKCKDAHQGEDGGTDHRDRQAAGTPAHGAIA
jgi:hypothetical protein